jgi:hypothetical protein
LAEETEILEAVSLPTLTLKDALLDRMLFSSVSNPVGTPTNGGDRSRGSTHISLFTVVPAGVNTIVDPASIEAIRFVLSVIVLLDGAILDTDVLPAIDPLN